MKHPGTQVIEVVCANCGQTHRLRSVATFSVEICSNCHPAYTGISRAKVAGDRVERFNRRLARAGRLASAPG